MKKSTKKKIEIGAGLATATVVAAGLAAYLLSGEKGKARKKKAKAWLSKAKLEIAKNVRTAKKLGESNYSKIVDEVLKKYQSLDEVSMADIVHTGRELKAAWKKVQNGPRTAAPKTKPKKK